MSTFADSFKRPVADSGQLRKEPGPPSAALGNIAVEQDVASSDHCALSHKVNHNPPIEVGLPVTGRPLQIRPSILYQASPHARPNDTVVSSREVDTWARGHAADKMVQGISRTPSTVDMEYMQSLLKAAEDEAFDELWQLRTDAEFWSIRMHEAKSGRRTSAVLSTSFVRIETFSVLHQRVKAMADEYSRSMLSTCSIPLFEGTAESFGDIVPLYRALQSVQYEVLDRLQSLAWPNVNSFPAPLNLLLGLVEKNDPTLRVMGVHAALNTIQREADSKSSLSDLPFELVRTLSDLSIVASCAQETEKVTSASLCYDCTTSYDFAAVADEQKRNWEFRERPWKSLLDNLLRRLDRSTNAYDRLPSASNLQRQHTAFWAHVDAALKQETEQCALAELILEQPVPRAVAPEGITSRNNTLFHETQPSQPTRTQAKRSRGRGGYVGNTATPRVYVSALQPCKPVVRIMQKKDKDFWCVLKAKNGSPLSFNQDFCRFMTGVGYSMTRMPGSGRSFEFEQKNDPNHHRLVFHEPHGRDGDKLPFSVARGLWGARWARKVDIRVGAE